jgi:signal peptidase I
MPASHEPGTQDTSATDALHIEALRQGQPLWFRVVSDSMDPTLQKGDTVYIVPAQAREIHIGEIAAFGTPQGFVIHRIVRIKESETAPRLLQMADVNVDFRANFWVKEKDIVGRVVAVQRGNLSMDLEQPIAQRWGRVTAQSRYWLYSVYTGKNSGVLSMVLTKALRRCSRLVVQIGAWRIRTRCTSMVHDPLS